MSRPHIQRIVEYRDVGRVWRVAVATTWRTRQRGLAHTESQEWNGIDGMLFRFPFAWRWPIWMCGMRFPIDALWFRHGRLVHIHRGLSPKHPWRLYRPPQTADALIELIGCKYININIDKDII